MFSIQQLIKALRKLQSSGELAKSFQHVSAVLSVPPPPPPQPSPVHVTSQLLTEEKSPRQQQQTSDTNATLTNTTTTNTNDQVSSQLHVIIQQSNCQTSHNRVIRTTTTAAATTTSPEATKQSVSESILEASPPPPDFSVSVNVHGAVLPPKTPRNIINTIAAADGATHTSRVQSYLRRSQQIQKFYQQQLHHFHTHHQHSLYAKQKQTTFSMSSLAAEPLALKQMDELPPANGRGTDDANSSSAASSSSSPPSSKSPSSANASSPSSTSGRPCFDAGFSEIIKFMELIGNLKHTKRTGWVLRDVNDCESISGHMYRMSMMTFLLDGTEGLNRVRCMELALVHDLAESLVGDITPFCGISKSDKRAMEFKAMEDICHLIEPRGKRIMELFEEYETGESAESKFVKDLDRLDMVMQAFEYEKRDNCLLKHQEFFDSTEGKFNHPFVKKLVSEIYEQRQVLAKAKGATPPPHIDVPNMEDNGHSAASTNGHCVPGSSLPKPSSS